MNHSELSSTAEVVELWTYPIKSCAGVSIPESALSLRGLTHDRVFMVVDEHNRFLTQRECPALAIIKPSMENDVLVLKSRNSPTLCIPLSGHPGPQINARVWDDTCPAIDQGNEVAEWFSDVLQKLRLRLVRFDDSYIRQVDRDQNNPHLQSAFADQYPLHLCPKSP